MNRFGDIGQSYPTK